MTDAVLAMQVLPGRVRVEIGGYLLADSDKVLQVLERGLDPVLYFPPESVRLSRLQRSTNTTYCPRKGEANYYSIAVGSCFEKDGVWYYPTPIEPAARLAGYFAFRGNAVDGFDQTGARVIGPAQCADCDSAP